MKKDKKKKDKGSKKDSMSDNLLDAAALSLKKFRRITRQIGKLSTGQKLAGGAALLAAGLVYLAKRDADDAAAAAATPGASAAEAHLARLADAETPAPTDQSGDDAEPAEAHRAPKRSKRPGKA